MTDKLRAAAAAGLEALINGKNVRAGEGGTKHQPTMEDAAIKQLRAALAEPTCKQDLQVAEPVAWQYVWSPGMCFTTDSLATLHNYVQGAEGRLPPEKRGYVRPLYTAPPRREWQGLTDEETRCLGDKLFGFYPGPDGPIVQLVRAIESALKEKNHV